MAGLTSLFDSNILIDCLNGVPAALEEIAIYASRAISMITWIEVLVGTEPQHEKTTRLFLDGFLMLPVTPAVAERAVMLRRQRRIKLPDALILATAEVEGLTLVTRNTRDFSPDGNRVRIPYRM